MTYNIHCTFRGRLDQGKGADLLLEILPQFLSQPLGHDWEFHIIGAGTYYDKLLTLSKSYPQIKLYGRSTRDQIKSIAQAGHYCLCPSTFLETFGMTALEGCKLGLPVITLAKGGLQQFIIDNFSSNIIAGKKSQPNSEDPKVIDQQTLYNLLIYIDQYHNQQYNSRQQQTLQIASQFGSQKRLEQINNLI